MPDTFTASPSPATTNQVPATSQSQGFLINLTGAWRPRVQDTLLVAERVRAALMHASGERVHWQLSGKDEHGNRRQGHDHAYVLPCCSQVLVRTGRIDRVLLWAKRGFSPELATVLQSLLRGELNLISGRRPPLTLKAVALEQASDPVLRSLLEPATCWHSVTPFVSPRHAKLQRGVWINASDQQLARLCEAVLGQAPVEIEPFGDSRWWADFVRQRKKDRGNSGERRGLGWRMRFAEPIAGPIALGYGAHFGLGSFEGEPA